MNLVQFQKDNGDILEESQSFEQAANRLEVTDSAEYEMAISLGKDCKRLYTLISEKIKPMKTAAKTVHTEVCSFEKSYVDPLKHSESLFKRKAMTWVQEEKRKADAALKHQLEEQLNAKKKIQKKNQEKGPGEADEIVTAPAPPPIASTVPKIEGAYTRANWKYKVTDFNKLPEEWKLPNDKALASHARATKGKVQIPGIEFYNDEILVS